MENDYFGDIVSCPCCYSIMDNCVTLSCNHSYCVKCSTYCLENGCLLCDEGLDSAVQGKDNHSSVGNAKFMRDILLEFNKRYRKTIKVSSLTFHGDSITDAENILYQTGRHVAFRGKYGDKEIVVVFPIQRAEIEIIADHSIYLASLQHQNIVRCHGVLVLEGDGFEVDDPLRFGVVVDYFPNSLYNAMYDGIGKGCPLSLGERLCILLDVARALSYLHKSRGVTHLTLTTVKILLDERKRAKLSQSLPQRVLFSNDKTVRGFQFLNPAYAAPELVFRSENDFTACGPAADVFSFGIIMWETLLAAKPFHSMSPVQTVAKREFLMESREPVVKLNILEGENLKDFIPLVSSCISYDSRERPRIDTVVEAIEELMHSRSMPSVQTLKELEIKIGKRKRRDSAIPQTTVKVNAKSINNEVIEIDMNISSAIRDLKKELCRRREEWKDSGHLRVIFGNKILRDDLNLLEAGLSDNSTVDIFHRPSITSNQSQKPLLELPTLN